MDELPPLPKNCTFKDMLERRPTGLYWTASLNDKFTAWAIGFTCFEPHRVKGAEFYVQNADCASIFLIRIYECAGNPDSFNQYSRKPFLEFSYLARDLSIYSDRQPIFFGMDLASLSEGKSYLMMLTADTYIGMGRAVDDLPAENKFHRGYFSLPSFPELLPVNAAMAWRLVYAPF